MESGPAAKSSGAAFAALPRTGSRRCGSPGHAAALDGPALPDHLGAQGVVKLKVLLFCLALGALLMDALEGVLGMALTMSMGVVQLAVGFSMAVGVVFGLYPAGKASKLRPIEALHYD